jgi:hypothetical protein
MQCWKASGPQPVGFIDLKYAAPEATINPDGVDPTKVRNSIHTEDWTSI